MRILLVEDEESVSTYLKTIMKPYSDVVSVQTLAGCQQMILQEDYDVILLDLRLKDAAPSVTIGQIPSIKAAQPDATLIVNTGLGQDYRRSAKYAGADYVLAKEESIQKKVFCAAIYAALNAKGTKSADLQRSMEILKHIAEA